MEMIGEMVIMIEQCMELFDDIRHVIGSNFHPEISHEFHVFSIVWDQNTIRWLRNDIQYHTINI